MTTPNFFKFIQDDDIPGLIKHIKNYKIGEIDLNISDKNGNYLLNYAIIKNNMELVKLLLEYGAYLDIFDADGKTLTYLPIKYSYITMLKYLLDHDANNIGVSILDLKDKQGLVPIHYAVNFKNYEATKLLIDYGANVNTTTYENHNALHLAIEAKDEQICKLVIRYISNIGAKIQGGRNSLHLAVINNMNNIAKILIDKGIDINVQDTEHHFTPLIYTVINDNKVLFNEIVTKCDLNIQDIFGNTILHYLITDDNYELFKIMYDKYVNKETTGDINFNIYNYDSDIPIHITLKNGYTRYLPYLIDDSNLNFQNSDGVTPLHYLAENNLWLDYIELLQKKKLAIFIINKKGDAPIDLVDSKHISKFINMVATSYLYILQNYKRKCCAWKEEWENYCGSQDQKYMKDEKFITAIKSYLDSDTNNKDKLGSDLNKTCSNVINKKLLQYYEIYKKDKKSNKSYPVKENPQKQEISLVCNNNNNCNNKESSGTEQFCTYTGTTLDVLIGLIYLLKKYKNVISTVDENFMENQKLCDYYKSIGIDAKARCEFLNFEVIWINYSLHLSQNFAKNFDKALTNKNIRFIVISLGIELNIGSHSNYMIFDKKSFELERFEPYGSSHPYTFDYDPALLDDIITTTFKNINKDIIYISPSQYEPKIGFQFIESIEKYNKNIGDPGGFCAVWALWYVEQRVIYADLDRKMLIDKIIKHIKLQGNSFRTLIRNYSYNIIKLRDSYFKKVGLTINKWMNDQYTDDQLYTLINTLGTDIITTSNTN